MKLHTNNVLLFVGGFPSGGTDLLRNILNAHPSIYLNGEMPFLIELSKRGFTEATKFKTSEEINQFVAYLRRLDAWKKFENLDANVSDGVTTDGEISLKTLLYQLFSEQDRLVWGNKTPQTTEHIAQLLEIFPSAKFIIVVRDVRDVCLSWSRKWGKDMFWCAHKWATRMPQALFSVEHYGEDKIKLLYYEDLLTKTSDACRQLTEFLNIPFSENMLSYERYVDEIEDGKINYGRPIIKDNYGKWRDSLSKDTVERLEQIAIDTMRLFGYAPALATTARPLQRWEFLRGVIRDSLAILVIGNRARKDNSIRERLTILLFNLEKQIRRL
jgi:hypothetical protein